MQISIANIIGSKKNILLPTEKYQIADCPGYVGDKVSSKYPVGSFTPGDSVWYTVGGIQSYGYINGVSTALSDNVDIAAFFAVNCIEDTVTFKTGYEDRGTGIRVSLKASINNSDLVSIGGDYGLNMYYNIKIDYTTSTSSGSFDAIGNFVVNDYSIGSANETIAQFDLAYPEANVISFTVTQEETQPSFNNTYPFTANGCNNEYFVRANGYSFNSVFPTTCI
jgi:hypothetical protein